MARLDLGEGAQAVKSFGLSYSVDGDHFESLNAGLPRPGGHFKSMHIAGDGATLLVSLVGHFQVGPDSILFPAPGRVVLRWDVRLAEGDPAYMFIDQEVDILPALRADIDFIGGLGDPVMIRTMFGKDFFDRQDPETRAKYTRNPEMLAVGVMGQLLSATREEDPTRVDLPQGDLQKTADLLWQLAQDIPDSSYAPYAAYFAGCCYSARLFEDSRQAIDAKRKLKRFENDLAEATFRETFLRNDGDCAKAFEAFTFAGDAGDAYLQPIALFRHATWRTFIFDLDKCEGLLIKAREAAPGHGQIQEKIDQLRNGLPRIKEHLREVEVKKPVDQRP